MNRLDPIHLALDAVWSAWSKSLPEIAEGWDGVRLERGTGFFPGREEGAPWGFIKLEAWPKMADGADTMDSIFRATYHGEVRIVSEHRLISWSLSKEQGLSEDNLDTLRFGKHDLADLTPAQVLALGQRAAADVTEWLRLAHDAEECDDEPEYGDGDGDQEEADSLEDVSDTGE
jgi:hypothetical protein